MDVAELINIWSINAPTGVSLYRGAANSVRVKCADEHGSCVNWLRDYVAGNIYRYILIVLFFLYHIRSKRIREFTLFFSVFIEQPEVIWIEKEPTLRVHNL